MIDDTRCVYFFYVQVHLWTRVLVCVHMSSSSIVSQAPTTISAVSVIFAVLFLRQGLSLA